jgi:hypothetical protein
MTKSAARRAIAGGCNARAFSYAAPTNSKSLHHKLRAGAEHGAGLFNHRNIDVQETSYFQTSGFTSRN